MIQMKIKIYETLKSIFKQNRNVVEDNNIDYRSAKMILKNDKNAKTYMKTRKIIRMQNEESKFPLNI